MTHLHKDQFFFLQIFSILFSNRCSNKDQTKALILYFLRKNIGNNFPKQYYPQKINHKHTKSNRYHCFICRSIGHITFLLLRTLSRITNNKTSNISKPNKVRVVISKWFTIDRSITNILKSLVPKRQPLCMLPVPIYISSAPTIMVKMCGVK